MHVLELDGQHLDARAVAVEDLLEQLGRVVLDLELAVGDGGVDEVVAYDLAHGRLGGVVHELSRAGHVEEVLHGVLDLVLHRELHVDHVLVARQHGGLLWHGAHAPLLEGGRLAHVAVAYLAAHDLGDLGLVDAFDGHGQGVVGAGAGAAAVLAEGEHHAFLVGVDDVDAGGKPEQADDGKGNGKPPSAGKPELGDLESWRGEAAASASPEAAPAAALGSPCAVVVVARTAGRGRVAGLLGALFLQLVPVPVFQGLGDCAHGSSVVSAAPAAVQGRQGAGS